MAAPSKPWLGLRWKLTLSYTLVTVAALVVVELLVFAGLYIFAMRSDILPRLAIQVMSNNAGQLYPFLEGEVPDVQGIQQWLAERTQEGLSMVNEQGNRISFFPAQLSQGGYQLYVLDKHLALLANAPEQDGDIRNQELSEDLLELAPLTKRALSGVDDPRELYHRTPDARLLIATPIRNPQGQVLGVFAFSGSLIPPEQPYHQLIQLFGGSVIFFTIAAGVIGMLFGYLTARGLTRRLRGMISVTDTWSQGEFSAMIPDRSQDELGQLARQLNRMAEQLQNLMQVQQDLAALEERNRLARDLHDSVKQQIFAITMQLGTARNLLKVDPDSIQAKRHEIELQLERAEDLASHAQAELTNLIRELRPANLHERGLCKVLHGYVADWQQQTAINAELNCDLAQAFPTGEMVLAVDVEQCLFRVVQEALANIARHSNASHVCIKLEITRGEILLTIVDNGQGFDPGRVGGTGLGLQSMRERVEAFGGRIEIQSKPGAGTALRAWVPQRDEA